MVDPNVLDADLRAQILAGRWVLQARRETPEGRELHLRQAPRGLSERQSRILERSALGHSGKEIAIDLGINESTVSLHLTSALERLQLTKSEVGAVLGEGCRFEVCTSSEATREGLIVLIRGGAALAQVLTSAECDVVSLVFQGRTNVEIALARRRSVRTVTNQLSASFRKLRVASRGELFARWAAPAPLSADGAPR